MEKKIKVMPVHFGSITLPELEVNHTFLLRKLQVEDANGILKLYGNTDVIKYVDHEVISDKDKAIAFIVKTLQDYENNKAIVYGLVDRNSNELFGIVHLHTFNFKHEFCTIGYLLNQELWGQGIAGLMVQKAVDFVFNTLEMHRIEAQVFVDHLSSIKVLEKNRFQREGRIRQNFKIDSKMEDAYLYARISAD